jgi:hypothetical protein
MMPMQIRKEENANAEQEGRKKRSQEKILRREDYSLRSLLSKPCISSV